MARTAKPWYREDRQAWFVTINGQRHNLGTDEKEAKRKFHELMADTKPAAPVFGNLAVAEVFEKFLDWCTKHRAETTYEWSKCRIQMFVDALGQKVHMQVNELKPFHLAEWLDSHTNPKDPGTANWSTTYRHGIVAAIQRPFNWAVKQGYISENPLRHFEKPPVARREQIITPEEWPAIRDHYKEGDAFRDLLEFAWETGCRPQEVKRIEARHVQLANHRIFFPKEEAKGKKRPRPIYMTPRAEAIITRLLAIRSMGLLFLNAKGKPWTGFSMNCRFQRLKKHLGTKYAAYSLRHGFATRKLEDGLDHLTVAALMGHADGSMLARVYSHVGDRQHYLHDKLNENASANG
jgi:integrase